MSDSITMLPGLFTEIPLRFSDGSPGQMIMSVMGAVVESSDENIATAEVGPMNMYVVIAARSPGCCTITYTNAGLSCSLKVVVAVSGPNVVAFDVDAARNHVGPLSAAA